jgi:hypothetical protein
LLPAPVGDPPTATGDRLPASFQFTVTVTATFDVICAVAASVPITVTM